MKLRRINYNGDKRLLLDTIKRDAASFPKQEQIVKDILLDISQNGDDALFSYTEKFDGIKLTPDTVKVSKEELEEAKSLIDDKLYESMERASVNIRNFHKKQAFGEFFDETSPGVKLGQKITPLKRVGIYVPGGKASYPSTVLMDAIPAHCAGVTEIIMVTPCDKEGKLNPAILCAAELSGVHTIYKIGGAQAVAALAYGTETIPKVDKIVGPGNIYVALAKRFVFGSVGLDSVAGPSEITVLCDDNANPDFVAADMLSQAEHDEMAQSILVCTSDAFADRVEQSLKSFLEKLPRSEIMLESLNNQGLIVICDDIMMGVDAVNTIAPEHLEVQTDNPDSLLGEIKNAGAIFLGAYSSEPLGDYYAGPNHVLPTNGTARFFSPLSTYDFVKRSSIISYNEEAFQKICDDVIVFANAEGLSAHANSILVRKR